MLITMTNDADEYGICNITPLLTLQTSYVADDSPPMRWITSVSACSWAIVGFFPLLWQVSHRTVEGVYGVRKG